MQLATSLKMPQIYIMPLRIRPGGPLDGPEGLQMARSAFGWSGGPTDGPEGLWLARRANFNFPPNRSQTLFGHITQSSEPSRRLGSEVSRVSGNPRGHVAKSLDHLKYFQAFLVSFSAIFRPFLTFWGFF